MKKMITLILLVGLVTGFLVDAGPTDLHAEEVFITIGGGDVTGVYFPAGLAIARLLNDRRHEYGIRATVEATTGSTFNLNAILAGNLEFGLAQSDKHYQAVNGQAEWSGKGPQQQLRAVFSLHHEALTLVAAADEGIGALADLKGKRVSTGSPGSGRHRIVMDALKAAGLNPKSDILLQKVAASEAPVQLQDNRIDAYFFTVGHPSENIRLALSGQRKARLIPIAGPAIDGLVAENIAYIRSTIPAAQLYPGVADQAQVPTFGVIATLCTSARVPAEVVYTLTKEVIENLELFRRKHPAFYNLSKEGMLEGISAPLHPGAHRYFEEIGLIN